MFWKKGNARNIHLLDQIYDAWQSKAILGCFDMVISGKVHAAVGALVNCSDCNNRLWSSTKST